MATSGALASARPARSTVAAMAEKRLQSPPSVRSVSANRGGGSVCVAASGGDRALVRGRADARASDGMIVGINDASHQVAAHHVGGGEADRLDATDTAQQADRL